MPRRRRLRSRIIFSVNDPLDRTITYDEAAYHHVMIDHGELDGEEELIKNTIMDPEQLNADKEYDDTEVYYKQHGSTLLSAFGGNLLKVPVTIYRTRSAGSVKTAFITDKTHEDERIKWTKSEEV